MLNWMEVFVTVDDVSRTTRGSACEGDEVGVVVGWVVGVEVGYDEGCMEDLEVASVEVGLDEGDDIGNDEK